MNFFLYELLPTVLNMSIIAGYVIIFVLIARLLLKKAPKIFSYLLWAVVLIRLLCPFAFESAIGLLPSNTEIISSSQNFTSHTSIVELPVIEVPSGQADYFPESGVTSQAADIIPMEFILSIVWLIGIAIMLIFSIISLIKLRRKLIGATPLAQGVYIADHIDSPFVMGLIKPKIYLPSNLSQTEQEFIISHEQTHIKRLDHITRILAFIALSIHWFNPLVWLAFVLSAKDMEISCDESVIKKMDTNLRADYSEALLKFATSKKLIAATPLAFGEGDTKGRVKNVLKYKKPVIWVSAICLVLVGIIAVALMSNSRAETIASSISFGDDNEFEFTLYGENTSVGLGNTSLIQGDEVIISISSESAAEIQVGIMPIDEFDNGKREEFIGQTIMLTKDPQEVVVQVPQDGEYQVSFINTTDNEVTASGSTEYITQVNNGYEANTFYLQNPLLQADMSIGKTVLLNYADEQKIVFHGYFGLFVYDIKEEKITLAVDLEQAVGSNIIIDDVAEMPGNSQWSDISIVVDGAGENIMLWSDEMRTVDENQYAMYINIATGNYEIEKYEPFDISSLSSESNSIRFSGENLGELKYIYDDMELLLFANYSFN